MNLFVLRDMISNKKLNWKVEKKHLINNFLITASSIDVWENYVFHVHIP